MSTTSKVLVWCFNSVKDHILREIDVLASVTSGLHFNASHADLSFAGNAFIDDTAQEMQNNAPFLWDLLHTLMSYESRSGRRVISRYENQQKMAKQDLDLGEIGGDMNLDSDIEIPSSSSLLPHSDATVPADLSPEQRAANYKRRRQRERAIERRTSLRVIRAVMIISIILQTVNQQCNRIQAILGIFFHSLNVPEKVIETLAHAGLSISLSSIHRSVTSLTGQTAELIKQLVRTLTAQFVYDNFDITFPTSEPTVENPGQFVSATSATVIPLSGNFGSVIHSIQIRQPEHCRMARKLTFFMNFILGTAMDVVAAGETFSAREKRFSWHALDILLRYGAPNNTFFKEKLRDIGLGPEPVRLIPLRKTTQVPCRAMKIKWQSTTDGNIQVIDNLHLQGGIGEPAETTFGAGDVDITGSILLFHGDLLTKERIDGIRASRAIEATQKARFQHIVVVPGLFHFKMAAADTLWRIFIKPTDSRTDVNSLMQHCGVLRPRETGKFAKKPGFRATHDLITHDIRAALLDCFRQEIHCLDSKHIGMTIEQYAATEPSLSSLRKLADTVVQKYVARSRDLGIMRDRKIAERDKRFENQTLRNRDELMYLDLSHAMNVGDIGAIEATMVYWCYLFKATGKHKYSWHTLNFLKDLKSRFSPDLREIIRINWLVNPTGKPGRFRGVDLAHGAQQLIHQGDILGL
ncbi:hypothetical protein MIND_01141000 [Mycena indigotica]|uniref:DUF6589 domain-containing protein n=1 Tax=Mycena indigotica TaxID=2126181 RepID=A0A8H6S742_9AGAR|nr:uncharacterized protein MIND_01141000 [Mycena indigotica]KAF7293617.1 hypothetical protein MIND_01141000 [Mycena indigotica]